MSSRRLLENRSSRSVTKPRRPSKLSSIVEAEEAPSAAKIAGDVVSDIVDRALEAIHERYLEEQTVRFVVHCAHQALLKALRVHFYQHNAYARAPDSWGSDPRVEPSSPDSWAFHQVPSLPESRRVSASGGELSTTSLMELDVEDVQSVPSEGLVEDVGALVDEVVTSLPIVDVEETEKSVSEISAFTMVVEGMAQYEEYKMKPQLSRLSMGPSTMFRLPRIDVPESGASGRGQNVQETEGEVEKLPPIRTDASYKCRSLSLADNGVKKSKSKKIEHN